jgi:hypothetical protein
VQNIELAYRVFSKLGGIEPPNLLAIPPQVASAEPGDSRVHVENGARLPPFKLH